MERGQSVDSAGDVCGELVVQGWVRLMGNVAEETEVESGIEPSQQNMAQLLSLLLQPLLLSEKNNGKICDLFDVGPSLQEEH